MDVEFLELTDTTARFIIRDLPPSQINAIRRVMVRDVPKMAIHFVDFHHGPTSEGKESTSAYFDEIVAHRLSLIPIPTDLELFSRHQECSCEGEGCPNCSITYSLNKSGPTVVYSGDLEPVGSGDFRIPDGLIPITKLKEDQSLLIYAKAVLGSGKEHAKWQAVIAAGYKFKSVFDLDTDACDGCGECVEACPRRVMSMKKGQPVVDSILECTACNACAEKCRALGKDAIRITLDPSEVIFRFETDGALTAKQVLQKALDVLCDGYDDFSEQIAEM